MKTTTLEIAVLALLIFALPTQAQEERDVLEISFFGGAGVPAGGLTEWKTSEEPRGAKTGWDIGIDAGYFVTSKFLLGLNFAYTQFSIDAASQQSNHNHRLFSPNLYIKYLFEGETNWVPYLKGHLGIENPKFSTFVETPEGHKYREISYDPSFALGVGAGLFYYTADYSGLFLEFNYHRAFTADTKGTFGGVDYKFGEDINVFDLHAGIRVLIGSGE
ncbi:MAG: outer membrane beta-barrel protein [Candidatus Zixiibacteriota bacterium]